MFQGSHIQNHDLTVCGPVPRRCYHNRTGATLLGERGVRCTDALDFPSACDLFEIFRWVSRNSAFIAGYKKTTTTKHLQKSVNKDFKENIGKHFCPGVYGLCLRIFVRHSRSANTTHQIRLLPADATFICPLSITPSVFREEKIPNKHMPTENYFACCLV